MTNKELSECIYEIHNIWFKKYKDISPVTDEVLDAAYNEGVAMVDRMATKFAIKVWDGYMCELQERMKNGQ